VVGQSIAESLKHVSPIPSDTRDEVMSRNSTQLAAGAHANYSTATEKLIRYYDSDIDSATAARLGTKLTQFEDQCESTDTTQKSYLVLDGDDDGPHYSVPLVRSEASGADPALYEGTIAHSSVLFLSTSTVQFSDSATDNNSNVLPGPQEVSRTVPASDPASVQPTLVDSAEVPRKEFPWQEESDIESAVPVSVQEPSEPGFISGHRSFLVMGTKGKNVELADDRRWEEAVNSDSVIDEDGPRTQSRDQRLIRYVFKPTTVPKSTDKSTAATRKTSRKGSGLTKSGIQFRAGKNSVDLSPMTGGDGGPSVPTEAYLESILGRSGQQSEKTPEYEGGVVGSPQEATDISINVLLNNMKMEGFTDDISPPNTRANTDSVIDGDDR
jgi:hypothetical protein